MQDVLGFAAAVLVLLVVSGLFALFQRKTYFLQYLFFLRFPLLLSLALVLLGLLGSRQGSFARNLFVLDLPWQQGIVSLLATLVAWVAMYTVLLMWTRLPARTGLFFLKKRQKNDGPKLDLQLGGDVQVPDIENSLYQPLRSVWGRMLMFILLAIPVIGACLYNSAPTGVTGARSWLTTQPLFALAGILSAMLLIWSAIRLRRFAEGKEDKPRLSARFMERLEEVPRWLDRRVFGYDRAADGVNGFEREGSILHRNAAYYLFVTLFVYGGVGWVSLPSIQPGAEYPAIPALAYVLLLMILLGWIFSLASFFLDKYRVLPEVVLVFVVAVLYGVLETDHYYATQDLRDDDARLRLLSTEAYVQGLPEGLPIVVVAASGGGITASQWTTTVLTRIQEEPELGPRFARAIRLISATSGGSVGTMYYVDAFDPEANAESLDRVRKVAGTPSLAAMGWGLVYPDFWRTLGWPIRLYDRGWALERRWSEWLSPTLEGEDRIVEGMPRLGDWRQRARRHEIPAIVFNATLVESGERLVLSSLDRFSEEPPRERGFQRFSDLYPDQDIEIATAARLSATFPWVTPVARPNLPDSEWMYHVADGGYYDNYGVMIALQFIDALLEAGATNEVILVEIRASDSDTYDEPKLDAGFYLETLGPAEALYSVRSASQRARNELELRLLRDRWSGRIERFEFELDPPFPLSWHLSESERREINAYWNETSVASQLEALKAHWSAVTSERRD